MQTIQFIPCTEGYSGTSLRGSIQASFADLKEMFGEPAYEGIGDKITTEFVIDYQVGDGEDSKYGNFTLYDWHFAKLNNDYEVTTWNVGGKILMILVCDLALDIFKETNESLVFVNYTMSGDKSSFYETIRV